MRFLADENRDSGIVDALRRSGHDVVAVRDVSPGATDDRVIDFAVRESRVLITEDKDFGQLVFASAAQSAGVIFIRCPASARKTLVATFATLVEEHSERIAGRFVVIRPGNIRISDPVRER